MKEFLFGLGYLIVATIALRLIGRLLVRFLKEKYLKTMEDNGFAVGSDKNRKRIHAWEKMDVADDKVLRISI